MAIRNKNNEEAIKKLKTIVDDIDVGTVCSFPSGSNYPHGVPMSRQEVDESGNIYYLCSAESETFQNLEKDNRVSLFYADPKNYTFLSINGKASMSRDQERIDKYWNKMMEGWFQKGKEDPNIRVLKVSPEDAHYWDTGSSKIVTLFEMLKNAITGEKNDLGKEGDLNL
ncbi:pyridoxamine 5'-phosphate oxidase family protein [Sphingobacterium sp. CZ-2]|uniref:pyridoxamine 5'-phosphate oxidase family protein n=1 Tax=Sphingobacterium sp. CZ-2 TaxID=2557994 RepID=UPI0010701779|nr:pyridoxamine 5'-phosphate oxidase family protein [Sphingobacterium sp. CZ-2]QBR13210.1 general stress protein [Sphingobacterium sp. CZ-2]